MNSLQIVYSLFALVLCVYATGNGNFQVTWFDIGQGDSQFISIFIFFIFF